MSDYIREWAGFMCALFHGMMWIVVIILSISMVIALPILVVALFYFILTLIFGVTFSWYIPAAVGLFILFVIGIGL